VCACEICHLDGESIGSVIELSRRLVGEGDSPAPTKRLFAIPCKSSWHLLFAPEESGSIGGKGFKVCLINLDQLELAEGLSR
jgi:hypothetical protein